MVAGAAVFAAVVFFAVAMLESSFFCEMRCVARDDSKKASRNRSGGYNAPRIDGWPWQDQQGGCRCKDTLRFGANCSDLLVVEKATCQRLYHGAHRMRRVNRPGTVQGADRRAVKRWLSRARRVMPGTATLEAGSTRAEG
ncbi:hypothetical protein GCM10007320_65820 [Pseudorhodoferax aquiterrae]|uniref:Secreted protein n=1 Tax=Pseudorhodoferax aquiterrae TaxID=747304 RepID=A0ABQ3GHH9_9BURK|nr:hypothetical protein GCM10007320_65820 [Pseudorhodoferax aquiterrae]